MMIIRKSQFQKKMIAALCLWLSQAGYAAEKATVIPEVNTKSSSIFAVKPKVRAQTTHIARDEIKKTPVTNLSELLKRDQSVVRLTNNSADSSQTALSIRGFGDNAAANSLILIDGFPLTNPSLLAPNFNSVALLDIERIDIVQGSESVLWGDQAVGGVVSIVTRHPEKIIFDTSSGVGSFNKVYYSGLLGNHYSNGFFIKALGFSNKTDNFRAHNQQSDNTLYAQLGMDYARGVISLSVQSFNNHVNYPGGLTEAQYQSHPRMAVNDVDFASYQTKRYLLLNKHAINDNWVLETRLAHHRIDGDGYMYSSFERDEYLNSLEPRLVGKVLGNKLTLGYYGQQAGYQLHNLQVNQKASAYQNNLFAHVLVPLKETLDLTVGARAAEQHNHTEKVVGEAINSSDRVTVSELGLAFHPVSDWQFFIRRAGSFRFPKVNEETWTPDGVSSLQPQTGISYEGGFVWQTERQQAGFSVYHLRLHDEIAYDPTESAARPFGSFNNFNETVRRGVTITERYSLLDNVKLNGQLNYVDARFASGDYAGNWIPAVPALNANIGFNYVFAPRWTLQYAALYTGSRYPSDNEANAGRKLSGYWLNTAALQYEIKSTLFSFEIGNLFNRKYAVYTLYDSDAHTNIYYPGAGRSYLLTLKTNLDG